MYDDKYDNDFGMSGDELLYREMSDEELDSLLPQYQPNPEQSEKVRG